MNCRLCNLLLENNNDTLILKMKYGQLFLNYNQCFNGRVMYVLNNHYKDITEIDMTEYFLVDKEIFIIAKAIKDIFLPQLINIASLGNHVQHLHWHIIPRYENDPNWGNPPWPHNDLILSPKELKQKSEFLREQLQKNRYFQILSNESINEG